MLQVGEKEREHGMLQGLARTVSCLELLHRVLHIQRSVLAEVDQADVAQLVPVVGHSGGVHRAQLQLLPLQIDLCGRPCQLSYVWNPANDAAPCACSSVLAPHRAHDGDRMWHSAMLVPWKMARPAIMCMSPASLQRCWRLA